MDEHPISGWAGNTRGADARDAKTKRRAITILPLLAILIFTTSTEAAASAARRPSSTAEMRAMPASRLRLRGRQSGNQATRAVAYQNDPLRVDGQGARVCRIAHECHSRCCILEAMLITVTPRAPPRTARVHGQCIPASPANRLGEVEVLFDPGHTFDQYRCRVRVGARGHIHRAIEFDAVAWNVNCLEARRVFGIWRRVLSHGRRCNLRNNPRGCDHRQHCQHHREARHSYLLTPAATVRQHGCRTRSHVRGRPSAGIGHGCTSRSSIRRF